MIVFATFARWIAWYRDRTTFRHLESIDVMSTGWKPSSHLSIVLLCRINRHIFVLAMKDVIVQDVIIASLLLEEITINVCVLFIRINANKAASSCILKDRLFNHCIIRSFCFTRWLNWEWASLIFPLSAGASITIQFLLDNFWQKCPFDYRTILQILIARIGRLCILKACPETNRVTLRTYCVSILVSDSGIQIGLGLIFDIVLHFFVLEPN